MVAQEQKNTSRRQINVPIAYNKSRGKTGPPIRCLCHVAARKVAANHNLKRTKLRAITNIPANDR